MIETLTEALEREHHEIDDGIIAFRDSLDLDAPHVEELSRAAAALRRHIYLEERFLFPPLRAAGMLPPVLVMLREHGEIWRVLDALDALDVAASPDEARELCGDLLTHLAEHNAKEEPIIYPQGEHVLSDEAKQELHTFIDSGEMPEGWVCAQA